LRPVVAPAESRLWNEYIARYHYHLGYTPMAGSQGRHFVFTGERLVALLSFGASHGKFVLSEGSSFRRPRESRFINLIQLLNLSLIDVLDSGLPPPE